MMTMLDEVKQFMRSLPNGGETCKWVWSQRVDPKMLRYLQAIHSNRTVDSVQALLFYLYERT